MKPLLPNRLAYPEIIPDDLHGQCLYADDRHLFARLREVLAGPGRVGSDELARLRASTARRFGAAAAIDHLDAHLERLATRRS